MFIQKCLCIKIQNKKVLIRNSKYKKTVKFPIKERYHQKEGKFLKMSNLEIQTKNIKPWKVLATLAKARPT